MKKLFPLILVLFAVSCSVQKKATKQADLMTNAMQMHQYEVTLKYTHPGVIKMLGGKKKYLKILETGGKEMKRRGVSYKSIDLGKPSEPIEAGNELHCLIPETITMQLKDGQMISKSHLLAVSKDGGKNWTFIETAMLEKSTIKKVLPNYNPKLKIPKPEDPKYVK